jgi:hypothetical protein
MQSVSVSSVTLIPPVAHNYFLIYIWFLVLTASLNHTLSQRVYKVPCCCWYDLQDLLCHCKSAILSLHLCILLCGYHSYFHNLICFNKGLRFLQFFPTVSLMAYLQFVYLLLLVMSFRKVSVLIAQFSPKCGLVSRLLLALFFFPPPLVAAIRDWCSLCQYISCIVSVLPWSIAWHREVTRFRTWLFLDCWTLVL